MAGEGSHQADGDRLPDGLEAMADVGRLGLEMAAAVAERMLEASRGSGHWRLPLLGPSAVTGDDRQLRRLRADADRLVELYADWMRTLIDGALDFVTRDGLRDGNWSEGLVLGPAAPGRSASARVWLHLLDGPAAGLVTLRSTDLTCHDGSVVSSSSVSFDPPTLDTAAARTSHEVEVVVCLPLATRPGTYHGHLLAAGLAEVWLELRLEVREPDPR